MLTVTIHPNRRSWDSSNDLAILRTSRPINLNSNIRTISIGNDININTKWVWPRITVYFFYCGSYKLNKMKNDHRSWKSKIIWQVQREIQFLQVMRWWSQALATLIQTTIPSIAVWITWRWTLWGTKNVNEESTRNTVPAPSGNIIVTPYVPGDP